jgi:hypothetical protein
MKATPAPSESSDSVALVALYVLTHPWEVFVERWNWKAALLSAFFRGLAFALPVARLVGQDAWSSLGIELAFRIVIGGFWGSLLQAFRRARPAWLAGLWVAAVLPAAAHFLEFTALRAGRVTHIKTAMVVSIIISIGSLLINWGLMRRGLLVTGDGGEPLQSDLRRIPGALAAMFRGLARNT